MVSAANLSLFKNAKIKFSLRRLENFEHIKQANVCAESILPYFDRFLLALQKLVGY